MKISKVGVAIFFMLIAALTMKADEKMKELLITGKAIKLNESEILLKENFSDTRMKWLKTGNVSYEIKNGSMELKWDSGGKLKHGQIFSDKVFPADIVMEFDAETIPPSDHDIIWWWNAQMNDDSSDWVEGYLGALGGWFTNQAGIEKISRKASGLTAMTPLFKLEPGRKCKIHSGTIKGISFLFVDGILIIELHNAEKNGDAGGRIGFGVYQSHFKISNLTVFKPKFSDVKLSY